MTVSRALVAVFLIGWAGPAAAQERPSGPAARAASEAEVAALAALESATRGMQRPATRALGQARLAWLRARLGAPPALTRALCRDALVLAERRSAGLRVRIEARVAAARARLGDEGNAAALLAALGRLAAIEDPAEAEGAALAWLEAAADVGAAPEAWGVFAAQLERRPLEVQCRLLAAGAAPLIQLGWQAPARARASGLLGDLSAFRVQPTPERLAALRDLLLATDRLFARWLPDPHRERVWAALRLGPPEGETWLPVLAAALRGLPRAWERCQAESLRLRAKSPYLALVVRAAGVLNAVEEEDLRGSSWLREALGAARGHADAEAPLARRHEQALLLWKLYPAAAALLSSGEALELLRGERDWAFGSDRDASCLALMSLGLTEALSRFPPKHPGAAKLLDELFRWARYHTKSEGASPLAMCAVFGDVARAERALFGHQPAFARMGPSLTRQIWVQLGSAPIERWPEPQRLLPCRALVECVYRLDDASALLGKLEPLHPNDRAEVQVVLLQQARRLQPKERAGLVVRVANQSGARLSPARWRTFLQAAEAALLPD